MYLFIKYHSLHSIQGEINLKNDPLSHQNFVLNLKITLWILHKILIYFAYNKILSFY